MASTFCPTWSLSESPELQKRQLLLRADLDQRQIVGAIAHQHFRLVLRLVRQRDLHLVAARNHVVIRQDAAALVDDEPRAEVAHRVYVPENIPAVNGAGNIHRRFPASAIDLDIIQFVRSESRGVGHRGARPQPSAGSRDGFQKVRKIPVRPRGQKDKAPYQGGRDQENSSLHFLLLRNFSYTARVCAAVFSLVPDVSIT